MSVHRINRFVFWVGGVVLPTISQLSLEILAPDRESDINLRLELLEIEKALVAGTVSAEDCCRRAVDLSEAPAAAGNLLTAIIERAEPLPGMPPLIGELSEKYRLALLSDYPRQWLLPVMQHTGLSRWLSKDAVFFAAELGAPDDYAGLFEALVTSDIITPGSTLWVDHNPVRTAVAVRQEIDASIFVDARRLYRDLGLWSLVPFNG